MTKTHLWLAAFNAGLLYKGVIRVKFGGKYRTRR